MKSHAVREFASRCVEQYRDRIERIACAMYADQSRLRLWWSLDDVVQAALFAAWQCMLDFNPLLYKEPTPFPWIARRVKRAIKRMIRRQLIRIPRKNSPFYKQWGHKTVHDINTVEERGWVDCPHYTESGYEVVDARDELEVLIGQVKPLYREALLRQYGALGFPETPGQEAAVQMSITITAYYLRANRGLHQLRGICHAG